MNDNNNQFDLDQLQRQVGPEEVEEYLKTGLWPWPDDLKRLYIQYVWANPIIKPNQFVKIIGIPPLPRGSIIIKLLFKISYNGILNISINGFKNPSDDSAKSFDFKLCEKIKLIPSILAKELLRKLLTKKSE